MKLNPTNHGLRIACHSPQELATRLTVSPLRLIIDRDELAVHGYQSEGVLVPDLGRREQLSTAELSAIAVSHDTPHVVRLVRVPQRTDDFIDALWRSGPAFSSAHGTIISRGDVSHAEAPPGLATTTINPQANRYVGLHIDAMNYGEAPDDPLMGIVYGREPRGLTICPSVNITCVDPSLQYVTSSHDRLARREQIRQQAAYFAGKPVCYTLWLQGSDPQGETCEAYANVQPRSWLHDGTTHQATGRAAIELMDMVSVGPHSFASLV